MIVVANKSWSLQTLRLADKKIEIVVFANNRINNQQITKLANLESSYVFDDFYKNPPKFGM